MKNSAARATCAPGRGSRHGQRVQPVLDGDVASARARRDGTRPRRCGARSGRGCAAPAGARSPARPRRAASPPALRAEALQRAPRAQPAALALERLAEDAVGREEVVALERRRLVQHLVRRRHDGRVPRPPGSKPPETTTGSGAVCPGARRRSRDRRTSAPLTNAPLGDAARAGLHAGLERLRGTPRSRAWRPRAPGHGTGTPRPAPGRYTRRRRCTRRWRLLGRLALRDRGVQRVLHRLLAGLTVGPALLDAVVVEVAARVLADLEVLAALGAARLVLGLRVELALLSGSSTGPLPGGQAVRHALNAARHAFSSALLSSRT